MNKPEKNDAENRRKTIKDMTTGSPMKLMVSFALPLLLGNLFQQFYNMFDAAIVGRTLGANALAGVGASSSVQFLVIGFCLGICSGFSIPVAQKFGAKRMRAMRHFVYNALVLVLILSIFLTITTTTLTPQILRLLNTPDNIYADAYDYLFILFLGLPFTMLYNILSGILRAVGDSKTPFYFLLLSTILNILMDVLFIVVFKMGVMGAAVATITAQAISGILCGILIIKKFEILWLKKEDRIIKKGYMIRLLMMGVPMGLQFSITAIGSMVMQAANNSLGAVYVSGFTAGMKIKQLAMCPFDAIANAVATFVGQNYGAGKIDRIKKGILDGIFIAMIYGICIGAVLILFGRSMSIMFVDVSEAAILDASALYLKRLGYCYWLLAILNITRMACQGLGFSGRTIFSGMSEMVARITVAMLFVPSFGYDAITWSDQAAWAAGVFYIAPTCYYCIKIIERKRKARQMH